jgi:hypothetical protein
VKSVYKKVFGSIEKYEVKSQDSGRQPASRGMSLGTEDLN